MRFAMISLALIFAGLNAGATSINEHAPLDRFQFHAGSPLSKIEVDSAFVHIDYLKQEVSVQIQPAFNCPGGEVCIQVMPVAEVITAKLESIHYNRCNQRILIARKDDRPADGNLTVIKVTDSRPMICEVFVPATQVEITQKGGIMLPFTEEHYLSGKALTP